MSGSSVVPGFPNMYCTPSCFRTSRKARLPDVSGMEVLRNAVMAPRSRRAASVSGTAGSGRAGPGHCEIVVARRRRPERRGPAEVLRGLGFPPLAPQRRAETLVRPDGTGVELHRASEGGDGLGRLADVVEHGTEVEVTFRPARPQLHQTPERLRRLDVLLIGRQGAPEIQERAWLVRPMPCGLAILDGGAGEVATLGEGRAEIGARDGRVGNGDQRARPETHAVLP